MVWNLTGISLDPITDLTIVITFLFGMTLTVCVVCLKVILGGGRRELTPRDFVDPEYPEKDGHREDGRNIIRKYIWRCHQGAYWVEEVTTPLMFPFLRSYTVFYICVIFFRYLHGLLWEFLARPYDNLCIVLLTIFTFFPYPHKWGQTNWVA